MAKKKLPQGFRERANGRLEYRFSCDHKQVSVYGRTIQECREKELTYRKEIAEGAFSNNKSVSMNDYFREYIDTKRGSVSESTIYNNCCVFPRISKALGKYKIKDIETRMIKKFREELAAEAADANTSFTTDGVNRTLQLLKSIMQSAVHDGVIVKNPCIGIKGLKRTEEAARDTIHRALSDQEIKAFFTAADDSYYKNLYLFLLNTGMRCGEACALSWDDINSETGTISISKTVTKTENGKMKLGTDAKTAAGTRVVPMNSTIKGILHDQRILTFSLFGSSTNLVFPAARGGLCKPSNIATMISNTCKAAGIEHFSTHAFRDTFASRAVDAGMPPETLKEILGHKKISITMDLYYHMTEEKKQDGMNKIRIAL